MSFKSFPAYKILFTLVLAITLTACVSTPTNKSKLIEREGGVSAVEVADSARLTFFKEHNSNERFCGPRQGDIATTQSKSIGLGFSGSLQTDTVSEGASQGAMTLGGRNPEVLLAREMLFRACELALNVNADPEQTIEIYKMFLASIEKLADSQATAAASTDAMSSQPSNQ